MYPNESISFFIKLNEAIHFFASAGKTKEKTYFWFYPKCLHAYGHIHFAWFCLIAKTI